MTLKEKFKERLYNQSHDDSECLRIKFENIDKVIDSQEKIADEFAIGFAEYFFDNNWNKNILSASEFKKQLEIYKKEKGL
jgi:plasmid maintenance system antidote protein VapI